jgi:hypothetical protein
MTADDDASSEPKLIAQLRAAKEAYSFPLITCDFRSGRKISHASTRDVEFSIAEQLRSVSLDDVRDGLSNVIFWGWGREMGLQKTRVDRFRLGAHETQILAFSRLTNAISGPGLKGIADLGLPEFSGVSFVSKIRMFLDPANYVVLDRSLAKLRLSPGTILDGLTSVGTQIRVTAQNEAVYERWSSWCRQASEMAFGPGAHAVDAERAIFQLVDQGQVHEAASIIRAIPAP